MQQVVVAKKARKQQDPNRHPQDIINDFWKKFTNQNPGKPFTVLPDDLYAKRAALHYSNKAAASQNAVASYDRAAAECKAKVEKIAKACRSRNQKYTDSHFDLEYDLRYRDVSDTLTTLAGDCGQDSAPQSVKRVEVCPRSEQISYLRSILTKHTPGHLRTAPLLRQWHVY